MGTMNDQEKIAFKNNLKQFCQSVIMQRIESAKKAIGTAQESANNEQKSSAGDKYETSRAMGHLEKDMYTRQLAENIKELGGLHDVKTDICYKEVMPGAFVSTSRLPTLDYQLATFDSRLPTPDSRLSNGVLFFIATGLGRQTVDGQEILFLSPNAPLSKVLLHKKTGSDFQFNGTGYVIMDVF
jgi:hypothetical protein